MNHQYVRAPHRPEPAREHDAPNAALLIDFDNVTMGIRSNLAQELRNLLNSDIIKGKVAVQRAYADWRRYPQYVVPLSEQSIDLIFAPAYGSTKKNATDIRLAIDAIEVVFTRPEIGTFIILSGDSDFSSLVLKLKEYGKYVIGVGIYESSSDLLIQNCDEYYSYAALTGLKRHGTGEGVRHDPWELVEKAILRMAERSDKMRSDRLKQVMLEIDPTFEEKEHGFSKFNKFVADAAGRGILTIKKLENGQYEVAPGPDAGREAEVAAEAAAVAEALATEGREEGATTAGARAGAGARRRDGWREGRGERGERGERGWRGGGARAAAEDRGGGRGSGAALTLGGAFELLEQAVQALAGGQDRAVRDRDVKRRMLELNPRFDERQLGYSRFSRFLQAAHNAEVVELRRTDNGSYLVALKEPGSETIPIFEEEEAARPLEGRRTGGPARTGVPGGAGRRRGRGREDRGRGGRGGRGERGERRDRPARNGMMRSEFREAEERPEAPTLAVGAEGAEGAEARSVAMGGLPRGEGSEGGEGGEGGEGAPARESLTARALGLLRGRWGTKGRRRAPEARPPILEGQTEPTAEPSPGSSASESA